MPRFALAASLALVASLASPALAQEGSEAGESSRSTQTLETTTRVVEDNARLRFGIDGGAGLMFTDLGSGAAGGSLGASVRLGVQGNSLWGLYLQSSFIVGLYDLPELPNSIDADAVWANSANVDFTFWNFFQVGVGAGADIIAGTAFNDAFPAFDVRLALLLGSTGPGARAGLALGLRSHFALLFDTNNFSLEGQVLNHTLLTLGFEAY
jgi:hypothetical protein